MTLLAILATVATVVVIVIVVIKVATSTGHAVAKAAARLWAWAGEPWAAAAKATAAGVRTGSGHGWSAAHGQRSMPGTPAKATATGTPVAPGIHGTTTVIDPPDPTPEMRDKAAKAAALGGRVGYRVGWGTGVGAATTTRALRHGRAGAKHAWRAAHPKPVTESGRPITWEYDFAPACQHCNVCGLDIPAETWDEATADLIAHRKSAHGLTGTGQDDDAPDDDDESGPAYCPHGIYALNHCPQCPDSPRWNAGEDPPPQTNPITPPAEPTGLWMNVATARSAKMAARRAPASETASTLRALRWNARAKRPARSGGRMMSSSICSPFFHQLHELLRVQRAVRLLHLEGKEQGYPD